jgi:hypothetical protein
MAKSPKHVSTADLKAAMAHKWSAPEHALVWEVGDATGGRQTRSADAIIMGLWPSRGIHMDGVEIKTYRSDWLRELKAPAKAEPVSRFCDHWWIHAGPDVVKPEELPVGWGLRVYDGRIWTTVVEAALRTPDAPNREFIASLLRRSDQQLEKAAKAKAEQMVAGERAKIEREIEERVEHRTRRSAAMASIAEEFEAVLGMTPEDLVRRGDVKHAAAIMSAILKRDLHNPYGGLFWLVKTLRDVADKTSEAMEEIGLEPPSAEDKMTRHDQAAVALGLKGRRKP